MFSLPKTSSLIIHAKKKQNIEGAGLWQERPISLQKNQSTMNRIPLDEMYLLYSLYGFRELTKEEQSRFFITIFEYEPYPEMFMARMQFEYENENGVKTKLSYALAGNRSEDHFYEHVMYEENDEEIEFSDFRKAIDYCNKK